MEFHGVKVALLCEDRLLLHLRDNKPGLFNANMWDFAGGGREGNETPQECAIREVQEEFAISLKPESFIWEKEYPAQKDLNQKALFMVARISKEDVDSIVLGEGQRWDLFDEKTFFESSDVIEALKGRFQDYLNSNKQVKGFDDTIQWYNDNSEQYSDNLHKSKPMSSIKEFLKYVHKGQHILEAGCGPGRETPLFTEQGIKTTGIDISEGLLKIAKQNNPDTEYVKGNFLELPFQDNSFDGVWAHASLVHLETVEDVTIAIAEFYRVTKNGGYVLIKVKAQNGDEKTAVVSDTLSGHDRFFRYYTPEELQKFVTDAGFEVISTIMREDEHGRAEVQWIEIIVQRP